MGLSATFLALRQPRPPALQPVLMAVVRRQAAERFTPAPEKFPQIICPQQRTFPPPTLVSHSSGPKRPGMYQTPSARL